MAAMVAGEQLQPDDLSVRGGRLAASVSPPPPPGPEEEPVEQPPPPTPQVFSHLSRLLQPAGLSEPPAPAGPLRCGHEQCTFETFSRATLDIHTRSHAGRRFYECDVCRMRFTNGANLRRHRMRHTGFKPYECRSCSKRFFRRDHLLEHMSTHAKAAGRRLPWQCPVCGKGFQRQIAMRAHYQNEHVRDGEWSGVCRLCGFGASSQQSLHAHLAGQHGLQLGSVPGAALGGPGTAPTPGPAAVPAPAQLLLAHHFLAPLELRAEVDSPPGSPRPSQVSPNSSEASPHSSSQLSPGSSECPGGPGPGPGPAPAAVKTEPRDLPAPGEDEDREEEEEEEEQEREDGSATIAALLARGAPGLLPNNGTNGDRPDAAGGGGGGGGDRSAPSRLRSLLQERRPAAGRASPAALLAGRRSTHLCSLCGILFPDQTLYFMHKGCHAENNPWKCNICSVVCHNVYEFNSHLLSQPHQ